MADNQGLIDKAAVAGNALSDLLTSIAGKPAREIEQMLLGFGLRINSADSPIPEPLRSVVAPTLEALIRAVALAPDAVADLAEAGDRALTGDK